MKYNLIIIFLLKFGLLCGQDKGMELVIAKNKTVDYSFFEYPSGVILKFNLKSESDVSGNFPEEIAWSYYCRNSIAWTKSLYLNYTPKVTLTDEQLKAKMKLDPDSNYLELINKIVFKLEGRFFCCIKFNRKTAGKKITSDYMFFEQNNGKWFIQVKNVFKDVSVILWILRPKYAKEIFCGLNSGYEPVNKILNLSVSERVLDFDILSSSLLIYKQGSPELLELKDPNFNQ